MVYWYIGIYSYEPSATPIRGFLFSEDAKLKAKLTAMLKTKRKAKLKAMQKAKLKAKLTAMRKAMLKTRSERQS